MSNVISETDWSYFFEIESFEGNRQALSISPDEVARRNMAQRLGLVSIENLKADVVIAKRSGEIAYHVKGHFEADVIQSCVVTLEPVPCHITENFEAWYADPDAAVSIARLRQERLSQKNQGEVPILSEKEDPEPIIAGKIDLGELVTHYLSLALDPYPHVEGAVFEAKDKPVAQEVPDTLRNPFAALKDWKSRLSGDDS
ncbi:MAG: DUF177 domain-containing protein [Alphaproteobacteria bacterium]|nr:DUF177 domain-containing protein [Alphaproteobacteria bacterium]